jgi:hypothetical protein
MIALSRFFEDAIKNEWLATTTNPVRDRIVRDAKPEAPRQDPDDIVRWTKSQIERLLAAHGMPHDVFGFILVDVVCGARLGEARGLQFKHTRDPRDGKECLRIVQQISDTDDGALTLV